ncbi:MAG: hypothetical protein K2M27_01530 [Muribaculaceae bacterium]|nr:hypothetical protein [Muribaculaceae bacterium]
MKSYIKKAAISFLAFSSLATAYAQTTYSGYFLDNYDYRFEMNPAFGNEKGFVSFPALGNLNINMHGNLHLNEVLYKLNGKTVLFTNPGISESEAMSKFGEKNRLGTNTKVDILSVGFNGMGGYNTVSLGVVANVDVSVPGSFFSLAKEGVTNSTYDIKNMFGNANAYAQLALNHSHEIKQVKGLRVGATLKVLVGAGNMDFRFNDAKLVLDNNKWIAQTNADIYTSISGFRYEMDRSEQTGKDYVSGGDIDGDYGPNGFGLGFDLGAQYEWNDFTFSAAVLDLGFMKWGKTQWASTNGTKTVDTDSYIFNVNDDAPNSFDNEWDRFTDDLAKLYQLDNNGEVSSRTRALAATLNFGAQYELPAYRRLHFGLMNSTRINGPYTWTQFRLSANINPVDFLSADVNVAAGTYGIGFGWLLNIHTTGFNLFAGMDHTVGKLAKQGIPLNSNASFNFGINFPF